MLYKKNYNSFGFRKLYAIHSCTLCLFSVSSYIHLEISNLYVFFNYQVYLKKKMTFLMIYYLNHPDSKLKTRKVWKYLMLCYI